jgi:hypothetical protein
MFNLAEDLGEWRNRVRDAACADARERLRRLLFCTVDPDRVNEQAFADQERRFDAHIGPGDASQVLATERVFKEYASRLGAEQARDLIALRCRRRAARSG